MATTLLGHVRVPWGLRGVAFYTPDQRKLLTALMLSSQVANVFVVHSLWFRV